MFNNQYSTYNIQMSNFTDLTFAQAGYVPVSTTNTLTINSVKPSDTNVMMLPIPAMGYWETTQFSFGLTYDNGTEHYNSIMNTEEQVSSF
jgi:hypothetical protein